MRLGDALDGERGGGGAEREVARLGVAEHVLPRVQHPLLQSGLHLANAGGVIVSYFEWVQANQAYWWRADEVESRLEERMLNAWQHVLGYAEARDLSLRTAATALAVERVAEAHRLRGLYP